jgi:hypothetical protein
LEEAHWHIKKEEEKCCNLKLGTLLFRTPEIQYPFKRKKRQVVNIASVEGKDSFRAAKEQPM